MLLFADQKVTKKSLRKETRSGVCNKQTPSARTVFSLIGFADLRKTGGNNCNHAKRKNSSGSWRTQTGFLFQRCVSFISFSTVFNRPVLKLSAWLHLPWFFKTA